MKKIGLMGLIFVYASFALVCFANVTAGSVLPNTAPAYVGHGMHAEHQLSTPVDCQLTPDGCVSDKLSTVSGHAEMYDSITAVELVSFGLVLLFVVAFFFYFRRLFVKCIVYAQGIWYRYKPKEPRLFSALESLAWTAFHTRSPNHFLPIS